MEHPHQDPTLTTPEAVQQRSGWQAMQPVARPPHWGVDRDMARRPGVPREREPQPWPNSRFPPARMRARPASPRHGRPNKPMPPVFGTAHPLRGLAGLVKRLAYRLPDHKPTHWLLMLLGDRVESWTHRTKKLLPIALPLGAALFLLRRARG